MDLMASIMFVGVRTLVTDRQHKAVGTMFCYVLFGASVKFCDL